MKFIVPDPASFEAEDDEVPPTWRPMKFQQPLDEESGVYFRESEATFQSVPPSIHRTPQRKRAFRVREALSLPSSSLNSEEDSTD